jgi:hypothetical protein
VFILDHISLELCPKRIGSAIFQGNIPKNDWSEKVQTAIEQIAPILYPRAVYDLYEVKKVEDECLTLSRLDLEHNEIVYIGPNVVLLNPAQLIVVSVVTLGEAIDARIASMNDAGQMLEAYIFDCVGVYALLQVSRAVFHEVERLAETRGLGVGSVISPGALAGWPLEEQRRLCSLLPLSLVGVRLNSSGVLIPQKSVSFLVGIGISYSSKEVEIPCLVCTNEGACWCKY